MTSTKLTVRPGINVEATPMLNEAGFSSSQLIRFFQGLLQKLGGWAKYIGTALHGTCRGIFGWQDLNSQGYIVCGTNSVLEVITNDAVYDITPQTATVNLTNQFTTITGTNTMSIHSVAHGQAVGNAIYLVNQVTINGKILLGYLDVTAITDADNFIVSTPVTFSASVSGATTPSFNTTNTSSIVTVTFASHGLVTGQYFNVEISTVSGGLTLVGSYLATVTNANVFTFDAGAPASSNDTDLENAGAARLNYLLEAGLVSATPSGGWGVGAYGLGTYGIGTVSSAYTAPRQWFFGNWGEDLIALPSGQDFYYWDVSAGLDNNPATIISAAPTANSMFIAMPERQVVALGADGDALIIEWSDVDDYTQWTPAITNQAGSYRLPRGSRIVGGLQAPQMGLIWTDLGLWGMQYIQPPLIYGFTELGTGCGLIAARAMGILSGDTYWMGHNNFFRYNGQVSSIPCPVWDQIFYNLNDAQLDKITCAPNSSFNEISWYYPSQSGTGEVDSYVKFNAQDGVWDYGTLVRTAWMDKNVIINAAGVDENAFIQQHEVSNDADSLPMDSFAETGWFKITDGLYYLFIERMIPDFVMTDGADIIVTISTVDYPNDTPRTKSFSVTGNTEYLIVRMRGRLAKVKIESNDLGSFWRLGEFLMIGAPAGRR